jgi:hypothetical protein
MKQLNSPSSIRVTYFRHHHYCHEHKHTSKALNACLYLLLVFPALLVNDRRMRSTLALHDIVGALLAHVQMLAPSDKGVR